MFHTPPYSLQPVSLQECYENIGKTNICVTKYEPEPKSPLSQSNTDPMSSSVSPIDKSSSKDVRSKELGSPSVLERKNRRLSHSNSYVLVKLKTI